VIHPTPWPPHPQERNPLCVIQEDGWAPGAVWMGGENLYSVPPLIRINWDDESPDMQKNRIIGFF
jgi:hypothetical protein